MKKFLRFLLFVIILALVACFFYEFGWRSAMEEVESAQSENYVNVSSKKQTVSISGTIGEMKIENYIPIENEIRTLLTSYDLEEIYDPDITPDYEMVISISQDFLDYYVDFTFINNATGMVSVDKMVYSNFSTVESMVKEIKKHIRELDLSGIIEN